VYCQLDYLGKCLPGRIRHALDELPSTLDETYERTLQEINNINWELARRLLHCVAVVARPLRVEELVEFLAFDFETGQIPKYRKEWRLEDPLEAALSTCSTLITLVNVDMDDSPVIQFSHFSAKEFLTSSRFAAKFDIISHRYHISMTPAHTLVAQACLGILLHLDKNVTRDNVTKFPLAKYAAEHWFEHARFEGVSQDAYEGMKQMLDRRKHHLAVWLWIHDPVHIWKQDESPLPPLGTPLHYAAFCGLQDVIKFLAIEHPEDVNRQSFDRESTPLHLASQEGHVKVAQVLVEHGADTAAHNTYGEVPLHVGSEGGHVDVARLLVERGADVAAQSRHGATPLHLASKEGHMDVARLLVEHGAGPAAQTKDGETPLHRASEWGHMGLARLLIERGADVAAQTKDRETPLYRVSRWGHVEIARLLIEHGADVTAQTKDGLTPLHRASEGGLMELALLLLEHGADVAARNKDGETPLHRASWGGRIELALLLLERGADIAAKNRPGRTPLHRACSRGHVGLARLLIEHGADAAARTEDGDTPLHQACYGGHLELARLLVEHDADVAAQTKDGETPLHEASWGGSRRARAAPDRPWRRCSGPEQEWLDAAGSGVRGWSCGACTALGRAWRGSSNQAYAADLMTISIGIPNQMTFAEGF
jgi:ankyrin repeat protein